jgi:hypothetical protein
MLSHPLDFFKLIQLEAKENRNILLNEIFGRENQPCCYVSVSSNGNVHQNEASINIDGNHHVMVHSHSTNYIGHHIWSN